jgi:hypothetical protein
LRRIRRRRRIVAVLDDAADDDRGEVRRVRDLRRAVERLDLEVGPVEVDLVAGRPELGGEQVDEVEIRDRLAIGDDLRELGRRRACRRSSRTTPRT